MSDQAVIVTFPLDDPAGITHEQSFAVYALEDAIIAMLEAELPEAKLDGHEFPIGGAGAANVLIFGPSAAKIADLIAPLVRQHWPDGPASLTVFDYVDFENGVTRVL